MWGIHQARWLPVLALVLAAWAAPYAQRLTFDQSIESLFADDNPRLTQFRRSRAWFGGDEFVILAYRDPELFTAEGDLSDPAIERLDTLKKQLAEVPGIDPATLQTLADALRAPYGRQRIRAFVTGLLVGADGTSTAIVSRLLPADEAPVPRAETFRRVREVAASHQPPALVVGEPIQVHDMFRYVEEDGATLGWWSWLLLMLVILILFRSLRWMVLPLLVVYATLEWTKGLLVIGRLELSMVSSMLNSLTTIIGIATAMHFTLRFRDLRAEHDRPEAVKRTVRELAGPVFWTVATTAAGFAALMSSSIAPVASFGLMMTLATVLVLVAAAMILPGGAMLGSTAAVPAIGPGERWITQRLGALAEMLERRPKSIAWVMSVIAVGSSLGVGRLELETDFSKNFRANSPLVQALDFFETNLGGSGTWELNFPAPAELTEEYLDQVRVVAGKLRGLEARTTPDRLTKLVVLTDGLDMIPTNVLFTRLSLATRMNLLNAVQPDFAVGLYNPDEGRMRIMLRSLERQPAASKLALIQEVERIGRETFPEAEATGLFVMLAYLIESLMDDQLTSSLLAAAAIVILMTIAERSVRLAVGLLLPNVFPIVLVLGAMGWLDLKVNIATAMIASVSMGLTIDSSIHYLAGYRRSRRAGATVAAALKRTHQDTGLALVWANVALVLGFSVLTLSHFIPLVYFGVLVSVAMIGGLIGNLILLPLLIRWVDHDAAAESSQVV